MRAMKHYDYEVTLYRVAFSVQFYTLIETIPQDIMVGENMSKRRTQGGKCRGNQKN